MGILGTSSSSPADESNGKIESFHGQCSGSSAPFRAYHGFDVCVDLFA